MDDEDGNAVISGPHMRLRELAILTMVDLKAKQRLEDMASTARRARPAPSLGCRHRSNCEATAQANGVGRRYDSVTLVHGQGVHSPCAPKVETQHIGSQHPIRNPSSRLNQLLCAAESIDPRDVMIWANGRSPIFANVIQQRMQPNGSSNGNRRVSPTRGLPISQFV